jgi:N-acyl-D-amino-acid deacylase
MPSRRCPEDRPCRPPHGSSAAAARAGWAADIRFDPARVIDKATFKEAAVYPEGIRKVIVNGQLVIDDGTHTGRLPGKMLRKGPGGAVA